MVDSEGRLMVETIPERVFYLNSLDWNDLREAPHHLAIAGSRIRISSPRCIGVLRPARQRGSSLDAAVRQAWWLALSPGRSGREWQRWKLVSGQLRWNGLILTIGFFTGLPLVYVFRGSFPALLFAGWLWAVMIWTYQFAASRSSFSSQTTSIATSAGVMPGMRPAWPRVAGRISVKRTCASFFKPRIVV